MASRICTCCAGVWLGKLMWRLRMRSRSIHHLLCVLLVSISLPVLAAKPISIEQLRQALIDANSKRRSDAALARQFADTKLSFRLTGSDLQKLISLSPGPKTTQALRAIADTSTFLDPSPSALLATPAPDFATQKAIISRT